MSLTLQFFSKFLRLAERGQKVFRSLLFTGMELATCCDRFVCITSAYIKKWRAEAWKTISINALNSNAVTYLLLSLFKFGFYEY